MIRSLCVPNPLKHSHTCMPAVAARCCCCCKLSRCSRLRCTQNHNDVMQCVTRLSYAYCNDACERHVMLLHVCSSSMRGRTLYYLATRGVAAITIVQIYAVTQSLPTRMVKKGKAREGTMLKVQRHAHDITSWHIYAASHQMGSQHAHAHAHVKTPHHLLSKHDMSRRCMVYACDICIDVPTHICVGVSRCRL